MKHLQLSIAALILSVGLTNAQTAQWIWATSFGTDGWDKAWGMAHDDAGNKYIIGLFDDDTMTIDGLVLTSPVAGSGGLFVCKYGPTDEAIWAINASGFNEQSNGSIRLDENGNLFISGTFNTDSLVCSNGLTLQNPLPGQGCAFRALCDVDGTVLSAELTGNHTNGTGRPLYDGDGNSYQTGWFIDATITLGTTIFNNQGSRDAYLVKLDDQGDVQWAIQFGSSGSDGAEIALDEVNNRVIVYGGFTGSSMSVGSEILTNSGAGQDGFLASIGYDGTVYWAHNADCETQDGYGDVEVDGSGNIYLSGYFVWTPITFGATTIQPGGGPIDWFLVKFDAAGNVLWADGGGGTNADQVTSLYLDEYGSVYISGIHTGDTLSFGGITEIHPDPRRVFLAKYDPSGAAEWIKAVDGNDYGGSYMDEYGFIYLFTSFRNMIDLDGISLSTISNYNDIALMKLDPMTVGLAEFDRPVSKAYPNPFASSILIDTQIPGTTALVISDLLGKVVRSFGTPVSHTVTWDGRNDSGTEIPPGMYLVTVIADGQRNTQRVVKQ